MLLLNVSSIFGLAMVKGARVSWRPAYLPCTQTLPKRIHHRDSIQEPGLDVDT